jgi:hypothetical protein
MEMLTIICDAISDGLCELNPKKFLNHDSNRDYFNSTLFPNLLWVKKRSVPESLYCTCRCCTGITATVNTCTVYLHVVPCTFQPGCGISNVCGIFFHRDEKSGLSTASALTDESEIEECFLIKASRSRGRGKKEEEKALNFCRLGETVSVCT